MERIEEFIEALKEKGIRIWSDNEKLRYQAAKGAMDSQTLEKIKEKKVEILEFLNNKSDIEVVFKSNQAERYEPFPLTNIQNSYVIGRNSAYELGDVTCHGYIEITYQEELDKEKLEMAWNKVIAKHDMLRAIIYENGYQRVQKDVPEVKIESYDLRTCSEDEQLLNLQNIRANYAEKQYPFRCVSSYIPKVYTGKMRVFDCESAIANFFPSLFSEDKKTWEQYAQGEFLFDTMKGDHISCMNSPYIEENVKKILDL